MRVHDLYRDFGVPTPEEDHKHYREGWLNTPCPFCSGNPGYHLGYNLYGDYYHCHRCGGHFTDTVLTKILSVSMKKANELIKAYGGVSVRAKSEAKPKVNLQPYKRPSGEIKLMTPHIKYLQRRGFDPAILAEEWGVTGTGPIAVLDKINYSKRLLAPIMWEGDEVSFQTRDVTGKHLKKYLACPQAREKIEHQTILYGKPLKWSARGICVEGITDVWRLGTKSFGTFGIDFTPSQVRMIAKFFKEVVVLFDPDPQARRQADKLIAELKFRGVKAIREDLNVDPGELTQENADDLVKYLLSREIT